MRYVGIDLAAEREDTAVAVLDAAHGLSVEQTVTGVGDEYLRRLLLDDGVHVCGVTAPLVPPVRRRLVVADREVSISGKHEAVGDGLDAKFMVRATDRHAIGRLAHLPPRVNATAETRGRVATRGRQLLAALPRDLADPSGRTGKVVEVDPCAAIDAWGLPYAGYVGFVGRADLAEVREMIAASLAGRLMVDVVDLAVRDGRQLNALIAALVATMARTGMVEPIPPEHVDAARREGWMHVPVAGSLQRLRTSLTPTAQRA